MIAPFSKNAQRGGEQFDYRKHAGGAQIAQAPPFAHSRSERSDRLYRALAALWTKTLFLSMPEYRHLPRLNIRPKTPRRAFTDRMSLKTLKIHEACGHDRRGNTMSSKYSKASRWEKEQWLNRTREQWFDVMRPFDEAVESFFKPAPWLEKKHIQNCRLISDRVTLLEEYLPKKGIVAEVGTQRGHFAQDILRLSGPKELHLIDLSFRDFDRTPFISAISDKRVFLQ
jgi:hypothetical protein